MGVEEVVYSKYVETRLNKKPIKRTWNRG